MSMVLYNGKKPVAQPSVVVGCEITRPQTNPPPVQPARKYIPTRPQTYPPPNEPAPR